MSAVDIAMRIYRSLAGLETSTIQRTEANRDRKWIYGIVYGPYWVCRLSTGENNLLSLYNDSRLTF